MELSLIYMVLVILSLEEEPFIYLEYTAPLYIVYMSSFE